MEQFCLFSTLRRKSLFSFRAVSYCVYLQCPPSPNTPISFHAYGEYFSKDDAKNGQIAYFISRLFLQRIFFISLLLLLQRLFHSAISNSTYCLISYKGVYSVYVCLALKRNALLNHKRPKTTFGAFS